MKPRIPLPRCSPRSLTIFSERARNASRPHTPSLSATGTPLFVSVSWIFLFLWLLLFLHSRDLSPFFPGEICTSSSPLVLVAEATFVTEPLRFDSSCLITNTILRSDNDSVNVTFQAMAASPSAPPLCSSVSFVNVSLLNGTWLYLDTELLQGRPVFLRNVTVSVGAAIVLNGSLPFASVTPSNNSGGTTTVLMQGWMRRTFT